MGWPAIIALIADRISAKASEKLNTNHCRLTFQTPDTGPKAEISCGILPRSP